MTDSTFRLSPNATFWVLFVSLSLIALLVFSEILLPFAAGFVLAYLFQPFVDRMNRWGVDRGAGAFIIIAIVTLIMAILAALILPPVIDQLAQLIQAMPRYYQEAQAYISKHYGGYLLGLQKRLGTSPAPGPQGQGLPPQITQDPGALAFQPASDPASRQAGAFQLAGAYVPDPCRHVLPVARLGPDDRRDREAEFQGRMRPSSRKSRMRSTRPFPAISGACSLCS